MTDDLKYDLGRVSVVAKDMLKLIHELMVDTDSETTVYEFILGISSAVDYFKTEQVKEWLEAAEKGEV